MTTSLNSAIVVAFADTPYPGDDRLTVYQPEGRKYDETFKLLRGRHWHEMPVVEFILGDTPIPDLTAAAFHYYLPALLLASLDDTVHVSSDIASSVAYNLSPASAGSQTIEFPFDASEKYHDRLSLFTKDQRAIIIRVLEEYVARGWESQNDIQETVEILRSNMK